MWKLAFSNKKVVYRTNSKRDFCKLKLQLYDPYGLDITKFTSEGKIDCFPLQSLLAAIGRTTVDYFTLDTQGHEFQILKGIQFLELNIKVCKIHD